MRALRLDQVGYGGRTLGVPVAEAPLHEAVLDLRERLLVREHTSETVVLAHELVLGHGRPDVVAAAVDLGVWRRRRRAGIEPCTAPVPLRIATTMVKLGREATFDQVVQAAGSTDRNRVRRALNELASRGWIEKGSTVRLRPEVQAGVKTSAAVEAKVKNWREAARQGQVVAPHVDGVWLAFPRSYVGNVPRSAPGIGKFGLISVAEGEAVAERKPRGRRATGFNRVFTEEFLYARWLEERSSWRPWRWRSS